MALTLLAVKIPNEQNALTNEAFVNDTAYKILSQNVRGITLHCEVKTLILNIGVDNALKDNEIGLNVCHRKSARIQLREEIFVKRFKTPENDPTGFACAIAHFQVSTFSKPEKRLTVSDDQLEIDCKKQLVGQFLTSQQILIQPWQDNQFLQLNVLKIYVKDGKKDNDNIPTVRSRGYISNATQFVFEGGEDGRVLVRSKKVMQKSIFTTNFNFEELGIGGLDKEFADIFRRAFASRVFPPSIVEELGITHVRGLLLFGPPGTGKTLIARQIGLALRAREPKIINGPEVLNKYVGQSEENVRNLFKDAEEEYKKMGDNSSLHIIIFDEIDAICKHRGSTQTGTGVNDSIVNQLLSKIDGVEALNNILLIGMTNRRDLIDEALLRPGRLEVHIEIGLPDEKGRVQILNIHTKKMREANRLDSKVKIEDLAVRTKNFSGAEIEGLVRSAASYAFQRKVDFQNLSKPTDVESIRVEGSDFDNALEEVKPAYGAEEDEFNKCLQNGIIQYGRAFEHLLKTTESLICQLEEGENTRILSILLHGPSGCGKTAVAAKIAQGANFPFMKLITQDNYVGYGEAQQVNLLAKTFDDAYKSQTSLIVLDNIERLIGYSRIGPRFSNLIMQALLVLVKKAPPNTDRRLLVVGTTSEFGFFQDSGMAKAFHVNLEVPLVEGPEELKAVLNDRKKRHNDFPEDEISSLCKSGVIHRIGIKQLLLVTEMAAEFCKPNGITHATFLNCLQDCGFEQHAADFAI